MKYWSDRESSPDEIPVDLTETVCVRLNEPVDRWGKYMFEMLWLDDQSNDPHHVPIRPGIWLRGQMFRVVSMDGWRDRCIEAGHTWRYIDHYQGVQNV
jgi:hypothetical protein